LLDFITACWFGFIGACIGSFLNVVAYRMPRRMSVVWKPSHCPQCGHDIRARDNLPVLGWLLLAGRCRDCRAPISPRYAIVEAIMGAAFFALAYVELFSGGANLIGGPVVNGVGAWDVVWRPEWPLLLAYLFHVTLLSLLMTAALIALDDEVAPLSLIAFAVLVVIAATLRWRLHHFVPFPAAGGPRAGVEAGLGFAVGVFAALVASQVVPYKEIAERERRRRNLALALGSTGGFLGLSPLMTVAAAAAILAGAWCAARGKRQELFRVLPAAVFVAAMLHIALWRQLAAWGLP
jgi:leader peptidase (prepilin peptidase)/N-methyltransferase